jgi:hypothetical protein
MALTNFKKTSQEASFDDGKELLCTHGGCGMRWSVNFGRPLCSYHQWGSWPVRSEHRELTQEEKANVNDKKYWAKRILAEHQLGVKKPIEVVEMAKRALRITDTINEQ